MHQKKATDHECVTKAEKDNETKASSDTFRTHCNIFPSWMTVSRMIENGSDDQDGVRVHDREL